MTHHELRVLPGPTRQPRVNYSYDAGYADAEVRYELDIAAAAGRTRLWVTWALVLSFALGGVFGVGTCVYVWPLVAAGVLP